MYLNLIKIKKQLVHPWVLFLNRVLIRIHYTLTQVGNTEENFLQYGHTLKSLQVLGGDALCVLDYLMRILVLF